MRKALSDALVKMALADKSVFVLTCDHGYALFDDLRRHCPQQYINCGVAEQNMIGVAAGMAKRGLKPICYGLSAFLPIRVLEQIKIDICYENLPIILLGDGAGVVYSQLGSTHQSNEDIACLRAIPNMRILSPCDAAEMTGCMELAANFEYPVYVRIGKADLGDVHASPPALKYGEIFALRTGTNVALVATGSMVKTALELGAEWPAWSIYSAYCIKPLSEAAVLEIAAKHRRIVVLEEHHRSGGLGSAIAEIVAESAACRVHRIGVDDRFSKHCGSYDYLMREHELDIESIARKLRDLV